MINLIAKENGLYNCIMQKRLNFLILLFVLMPFTSVYSQMAEIEALTAYSRSLQEKDPKSTSQGPSDEATTDEKVQSDKLRDITIFEDTNYGYTGGKTFIDYPQEKFFDKPLSYFGYDFFTNQLSSLTQLDSLPIPADYIVGPEDTMQILFYGGTNRQHNLKVSREGIIQIPNYGPLSVAGQTFQELKEQIRLIANTQYLNTLSSVTLGELRSIEVFVLGEATRPGLFQVGGLSTLTNAIFASGGVNVTGSLRNIQLKRKGEVVSTFDFYDLLLKGDTSDDSRLMQGDAVFIPPIGKTVAASGEIGRPGIYELKDNENLGDLIRFAGNLKPKADVFSADLQRVDPSVNGFSLIPIDFNKSSMPSFELNNGDVLRVHSVVDNLKNAVLVTGHAKQPGFFPWNEGMRIGDVVRSKDDLLSMTDLSYVLVKRQDNTNQRFEFMQVDLEEVFANHGSDANIHLHEKDEIILLPSLITPDQITTKLFQDKYFEDENNQLVLEDEWRDLSYMRKSLMEEKMTVEDITPVGQDLEEELDVRRYYEYSVYDYCTISEDLAVKIIDSTGFQSKASVKSSQYVPLEELEQISKPEDVIALQIKIGNEQIKSRKTESLESSQLATTITDDCRWQLLDPQLEVIKRQVKPTEKEKIISVFGSVHFPGTYPLTVGMQLQDAIKASGGLKNATYGSEIEISRRSDTGKKLTVTQSFASISDPQAMAEELQEMDLITLKQISTDIKTVQITGEVYFAGTYPISENQTVTQLIKRAGGVTENASLKAAYFQRQSLKEAELKRTEGAKDELRRKILLSSQSGGLGMNSLDSNAMTQLTALITGDTEASDEMDEVMGRLVVDLEAINAGLVADIILEDGDKLHIPEIQQSVSVIGEVFVANSHLFKNDLTISNYIDMSGGASPYADEDSIYLIRSDGRIVSPDQLSNSRFFRGNFGGLEPGDTIVVPLEVQPFSGIKATTEITQIVYQMALAAAAVNSF